MINRYHLCDIIFDRGPDIQRFRSTEGSEKSWDHIKTDFERQILENFKTEPLNEQYLRFCTISRFYKFYWNWYAYDITHDLLYFICNLLMKKRSVLFFTRDVWSTPIYLFVDLIYTHIMLTMNFEIHSFVHLIDVNYVGFESLLTILLLNEIQTPIHSLAFYLSVC